MKHYCTLSDKNYLKRGIVLLDSLKRTSSEDFILYYLCMDEETYVGVSGIENVKAIPLSELESEHDFDILKKNTQYIPNSSDCTFCFALGSYFTEYIVRKYGPPDVLYIDADIIFYQDPKLVVDAARDKSIGIILHRHVPLGHHVGGYNVGVVYFRNDDVGYKCLKWWRDCVMDPTNEWFEQYGRVGDQVYLEGFAPLFGESNVAVLDDMIGHGAPWNLSLYQYDGDEIVWKRRRQKMVFIHFSHFTPNFENDTYSIDRSGEWDCVLSNPHPRVIEYYDDYFERLKK